MATELLLAKDVKTLDLILKTVMEMGSVHPIELPQIEDSLEAQVMHTLAPEFEYEYYFNIMIRYGVISLTTLNEKVARISAIRNKTNIFYGKGGFKAEYYQQQHDIKRSISIEKMGYEKLEWDLKVSKFQAKTKWWPLGISIISIIIAIWAFLKG